MQELSSILLGVALLASAALVAWGLALMFRPQSEAQEMSEPPASWAVASGLLLVTGIAVVAFAIRAVDIEHRGMTHVEVYVPGIELPDDISTPQPRIGIGETLKWHYFREPHPPAYYIMGWAWTRVAGTELWVLRLPSVLLGAASIFLVYALGVRTGGRAVGLLAALPWRPRSGRDREDPPCGSRPELTRRRHTRCRAHRAGQEPSCHRQRLRRP